jgi:hypothetical protein
MLNMTRMPIVGPLAKKDGRCFINRKPLDKKNCPAIVTKPSVKECYGRQVSRVFSCERVSSEPICPWTSICEAHFRQRFCSCAVIPIRCPVQSENSPDRQFASTQQSTYGSDARATSKSGTLRALRPDGEFFAAAVIVGSSPSSSSRPFGRVAVALRF